MSTNYVITNGKIYTEKQVIENGYLVVEDGKISDIQQGTYTGELEQIDVKGQNVLPGFIDIHIHGGYGEDAMDASYDGLKHLAEQLLSEGTTTFLATTMTQSDANIEKALKNIVAYQADQQRGEAAEVGGVHLEGPFISEHKVGAQNPKYVQRPSASKIQHFQEVAISKSKLLPLRLKLKAHMIHLINCMKILSSQWGILWQRLMKRMKRWTMVQNM